MTSITREDLEFVHCTSVTVKYKPAVVIKLCLNRALSAGQSPDQLNVMLRMTIYGCLWMKTPFLKKLHS